MQKKWTNKEDEDNGGSAPVGPPPKISEIPSFKPPIVTATPPAPSSLPPLPTGLKPRASNQTDEAMNNTKMIAGGGGNMYKLSRGRNMRANYVDVMNPNKLNTGTPPAPTGSPAAMMPMAASSPNLFIPEPSE